MGEEQKQVKRSIAIGDEPVILKETIPAMTTPKDTPKDAPTKWNTNKLGLRLGSDALAACAAGTLVAPIITMIDKGIMENASGRNTLGESLKTSARELLLKPHRFLGSRPFVLIFSLYFGTYFTANSIDTVSSARTNTAYSSTTAGTSKFLAVSTSNLALCLYKDNQFTQLFGSSGSKRPVPLPTFALFTVRDCLTIFASFNLPPLFAPKIDAYMGDEMRRYVAGASVAQFATPAAIQFVSTPLHLLGLDLYNRPGAGMAGAEGRVAQVVKNWAKSAFARIGRIIPAFGVGGVVNTKVRRGLMERLE
ncbi:hypothetical protein C7974DRAFT_323497 [Boeremia exigua]|uniref:uncharacterized protein n=1 Tax=Boeremia exigua TaxID=749465 RepID=UPI001E8EEEBF|nr:uncharacterized protein C7974DRAFT_323497 [Boeremia exigua]KAH6612094.1 hypothetical protein C7974DRAFT_323497 [Boeremia exigua]